MALAGIVSGDHLQNGHRQPLNRFRDEVAQGSRFYVVVGRVVNRVVPGPGQFTLDVYQFARGVLHH
jgi:hypothetical protein